MSRMKHSSLPTRYWWFSCQRSKSLECRWMVPHWAEFAFTRGVNKLLPASTPPLNAISSHWAFRGAKSLPLVDSKMLVIIQHGIHLLGQQGLVEIPKAMFSSLLWSFMFPFCWETADVHIMSPHVLSEVPVENGAWVCCTEASASGTAHDVHGWLSPTHSETQVHHLP